MNFVSFINNGKQRVIKNESVRMWKGIVDILFFLSPFLTFLEGQCVRSNNCHLCFMSFRVLF